MMGFMNYASQCHQKSAHILFLRSLFPFFRNYPMCFRVSMRGMYSSFADPVFKMHVGRLEWNFAQLLESRRVIITC